MVGSHDAHYTHQAILKWEKQEHRTVCIEYSHLYKKQK